MKTAGCDIGLNFIEKTYYNTAQLDRNLEVGGANSYFVGELKAWAQMGTVLTFEHHAGPTSDRDSFILEHALMCKLEFNGKGTNRFFNKMWGPGRKY